MWKWLGSHLACPYQLHCVEHAPTGHVGRGSEVHTLQSVKRTLGHTFRSVEVARQTFGLPVPAPIRWPCPHGTRGPRLRSSHFAKCETNGRAHCRECGSGSAAIWPARTSSTALSMPLRDTWVAAQKFTLCKV